MPALSTAHRPILAEFLGTFALVFVGCGGLMVGDRFPGSVPGWAIPVVFGLVVALMIRAFGSLSGAHFNPAVTAAFVLTGHLPKRQAPGYWFAQFLGAVVAIALLGLLLPAGDRYGGTVPSVSAPQALAWEMVLSFLLMLVILTVSSDPRPDAMSPPIAIGATVALDAWIGGPVTGASMNPARSLAPALAEGHLEWLWLYFLGPVAGMLAAALVYILLFARRPDLDLRSGDLLG